MAGDEPRLLVGLFVLPRFLAPRSARLGKVGAIVLGTVVFLYANYGGALAVLPDPEAVVGPIATLALSNRTTAVLMTAVNSLLVGPPVIAGFGVLMNRLLTRPELRDVPGVRHTLPRRDPDRIVVTSAAAGTVFYLVVLAVATGQFVVVP